MIYSVSLAWTGILVGLALIASHGWALARPDTARTFLAGFPRHLFLGRLLLAAATLWFALLLGNIDLMEYTPHRKMFVVAVLIIGGLSSVFLVEFLAVRALGALLLLAAQVLLDAAFPRDLTARLAVTVTAYAWIIAGMFLVGMPYILRDAVAWLGAKPLRLKGAAAAGVAWGALLLILGFFVY